MHIRKVGYFKGFTLIETTTALFISSIFMVFTILILFNFVNFYSKQIEIQNQDSYVSEGMLIIENLMNGGDVEIKNGAIAINKNSDEYNLIQFDKYSEKLIVDYYRYNIKVTSNNVMFKIKNFNIVRNNNLVYIFITCKDGRRYMRCFILKSQSNQASA